MTDQPLTPEELRLAGEALYGPWWQTEMTRAIGLGDSARIRQWLRRARPIPLGLRAELVAMMRARAKELTTTADSLSAAGRKSHHAIAEAPTDRKLVK